MWSFLPMKIKKVKKAFFNIVLFIAWPFLEHGLAFFYCAHIWQTCQEPSPLFLFPFPLPTTNHHSPSSSEQGERGGRSWISKRGERRKARSFAWSLIIKTEEEKSLYPRKNKQKMLLPWDGMDANLPFSLGPREKKWERIPVGIAVLHHHPPTHVRQEGRTFKKKLLIGKEESRKSGMEEGQSDYTGGTIKKRGERRKVSSRDLSRKSRERKGKKKKKKNGK